MKKTFYIVILLLIASCRMEKQPQNGEVKIEDLLKDHNTEVFDILKRQALKITREKDYQAAEQLYDSIVGLYPHKAESYMIRGRFKGSLLRFKDAIIDFNKVIELDSNYAEAYYYIAVQQIQLAEFERACENLFKSKEFGNPEAKKLWQKLCAKVEV